MPSSPTTKNGATVNIVVLGRGNVGGPRPSVDERRSRCDGARAGRWRCVACRRAPRGRAGRRQRRRAVEGDGRSRQADPRLHELAHRNEGFPSLAAEVKSIVRGPTIKAFNTNFAALYAQIAGQRVRPHSVFAADPDARELAERLIGDAGFDPLYVGGLDNASTLEAQIAFTMMLARGEVGPYFYRFATSDL